MYRQLAALALIFTSCCIAAPMYKVVDADGNVTYTDTPPNDTDKQAAQPIEGKPLNVLEGSDRQDYQKAFDTHAEQRQQMRDEAWKNYDDAVRQAEQKLTKARQALQQGGSASEGDFVGVYANGRQTGVRPSDAYLKRQEALKQAVADAEAELAAAKRNKPKLSR